MGVIGRIVEVADNQFKYISAEDCVASNIDYGTINHAAIFLKSVVDFYSIKLTKENFEEHKRNWIDSLGNIEK